MQEMKRVQLECRDPDLPDDDRKKKAEDMMKKFVAVMGFNDDEESYGEEEQTPNETDDEKEARLFQEAVEEWRVEKPAAKIIESNMK